MQTKEVLTEWSKNKEQVFMYRRYEGTSQAECVVVGFHTETGRTGYSKWDKKPDRMWVDIINYSYNDRKGRAERVLARYLTTTAYKSIVEYHEQKDKWELERLDTVQKKKQLTEDFAEVCKSLSLGLRIEDVNRHGYYQTMVVGDMEAFISLLGTLRDAKQYYDSIVEEVVA
jgi:hypothetical protein